MISNLTTLGFYLSAIPFFYFIFLFYIPKKRILPTYIVTFVTLLLMLFLDFKIYNYTYQRFFLCITFLYLIIIFLYDGSVIEKLIGPFLSLGIIVLCETPFGYFLLNLGYTPQTLFGNNGIFIIQVIIILISMLLILLSYRFINCILYSIKKQKTIFFLICLSFFVVSMSVAQSSIILMLKNSKFDCIVYLALMFLIALISNTFLLKYIRKSYDDTKATMTKFLLENEYKVLLKSYSNTQDEFYNYLRHDLMNYILRDNVIDKAKEKGDLL